MLRPSSCAIFILFYPVDSDNRDGCRNSGLDESSSSARISRYEGGIHEPSVQFAEALAKVLGVSAPFFYCRDDRLADIILLYADMPDAKHRSLRELHVSWLASSVG